MSAGWIVLGVVFAVDLFALAWLAAYWPSDPRKGHQW